MSEITTNQPINEGIGRKKISILSINKKERKYEDH